MKTNKILKYLLFTVLVFSFIVCNLNDWNNICAEFQTSAKAMVVIDAETNDIFYSHNHTSRLAMASTTKIVTALTVLKHCKDLDEVVNINPKAVGIPGTSIYLKNGESLSVRELLYGMMLPSGNDAATALAYHIGGNIEDFCEMMKEVARSCGANDSSFANPHGLDNENHYTTAYDLAKITAEALKNEDFVEIVTTKNTKIKGYGDQKYRYLKNKNKLLSTLDGCMGVKTGFTDDAGRCLVSACERNGLRTVCVVLNCGPMFEESFDLINSVYNNYQKVNLLSAYKQQRSLNVENGRKSSVKCYSINAYSKVLKNEEIKDIRYEYDLPTTICAPIKKEEIVGEIKIYLKNDLLFSEKIYTMEEVKSIGIKDNIKEVLSRW